MRGDFGDTISEDALDDAARFGIEIDPETLALAPEFELWDNHAPAFWAFMTVEGQWRCTGVGMGGIYWIGLDYAAVKVGLDLAGIALDHDEWEDFRQIEAGARKQLNSR